MIQNTTFVPIEVEFSADALTSAPSRTTDVTFSNASGDRWIVPTFLEADGVLRARFSARLPGTYRYALDESADNSTGEFEVEPYTGDNPLYKRGPIRSSNSRRYLEYADGTPFFWLADTWWMGLTIRLRFDKEFQNLAHDRVEKGFTVIQIVAGPYPDMDAFDPRGENEAGHSWHPGFEGINHAYYDLADKKIDHLVSVGLVPCIVGCWGYYIVEMGVEKMREHWRNLVARYSAYPVVFCLAGEATMPYYLSTESESDADTQRAGWTGITNYVRDVDPFNNLLTIHPTRRGREQIEDPSLIDFEMLQTGHDDRSSIPDTVAAITEAYQDAPVMPVINSEVCYEGIGEASRQEIQRLMFWVGVLNGACGHTYGANGLWQLNSSSEPYGASPHGMSWGGPTWQEAAELPGSAQLGMAKRLLERYEWWHLKPAPGAANPAYSVDSPLGVTRRESPKSYM